MLIPKARVGSYPNDISRHMSFSPDTEWPFQYGTAFDSKTESWCTKLHVRLLLCLVGQGGKELRCSDCHNLECRITGLKDVNPEIVLAYKTEIPVAYKRDFNSRCYGLYKADLEKGLGQLLSKVRTEEKIASLGPMVYNNWFTDAQLQKIFADPYEYASRKLNSRTFFSRYSQLLLYE